MGPPSLPPPSDSRLDALRSKTERVLHHAATELTIVVLIAVSVGLLLAETAVSQDSSLFRILSRLGEAITVVFAVELLARYWIAPKKSRFFRRYWLDILSVLPLAQPLRLLRILRLLRLFRAGVLLNRRMSVFQGVFQGAAAELTMLGTLSSIFVLAGSLAVFLAERGNNPDFATFDETLWFSVYSLVGGEPIFGTPTTTLGRLATLGLMFGGLSVFGVFVGTVSASMVPRLSRRMRANEMDTDELSGHVVVCGWNSSGRTMIEELMLDRHSEAVPVVIITESSELPEGLADAALRPELIHHVTGDFTRVEVLEQAGIRRASTAILLADSTVPLRSEQDRDARTVLAGLTIERLARGIFTCAQLNDRQNEQLLRMAGVEEIVVTREYTGFVLGAAGRSVGIITVLDDLLSAKHGSAFFRTHVPPQHAGRTVGELHDLLKAQHGAVLIAAAAENGKLQVNPPSTQVLPEGAPLLVIADAPPKWQTGK